MSRATYFGHLGAVMVLAACIDADQPTGLRSAPPPTPPPAPPIAPPPAPPALTPAAISIESGNHQEGRWGVYSESLPLPFVVRVADSAGKAVSGVPVMWKVATGAGRLPGDSVATSATDAIGFAHVYFIPTGLGTSTVTAAVDGVGSVTFTALTAIAEVTTHWFAARFAGPPDYGPDLVIPLGTVVEWVHVPSVTSFSVPPDGEPFDSGQLQQHQRFQFIPNVTGTWEYYSDIATWQTWGWCLAQFQCETPIGTITVE